MIPRYTLPEMAAVWSDEARLRHWLRIEVLACEAWGRLGRIPGADLTAIRSRATFSVEGVAEIERVTNHDVAAFVQNVAESIGPEGRWIHFGMTSSDLLDTALGLQLREAADLLLARLERLMAVVRARALEHRSTVMMGRTHGVHAEPITFGHKLALWTFELDRDRERLRRAHDVVSVGKVSRVVGTFAEDPTHPQTFPTLTTSCARRSRSRSRSSSNVHRASLWPNVMGSAWTPWVRPIITVLRCSIARARTTAISRSSRASSRSAASRSCSPSAVSSRSDEVMPKWIHRPSGPMDSATFCTNAATSWFVTRSNSATRSTENVARERIAVRSASGIRPRRPHASQARTSILSQWRSRASSDQTAPISGCV